MSTQQIDRGLQNYYRHKNTPYVNDQGIGKFAQWAADNGYDTDIIEEEINELNAFRAETVHFDDEFPTDKMGDDRLEEIFDVLEICWKKQDAFKQSANLSKYSLYKYPNIISDKIKLAAYGYVKQLTFSLNIPDVITQLIIKFFPKFYFNWKDSKYGNGVYQFNNADPSRITRSLYGNCNEHNAFLTMNHVLSLDVCKRFEWELQIQKLNEYGRSMDWVKFSFGFVKYPMEKSILKFHDNCFGQDQTTMSKQFGIFVWHGFFRTCGHPDRHGKILDFCNKNQPVFRVGDRFGMNVDFETKDITFIYNAENAGVIYSNIPDKIHPALNIMVPMEFKCTKYVFK